MAIIIALSVHEFAHAYVAYKFGRRYSKETRAFNVITDGPFRPYRFDCSINFGFGWARPVPVNPYNFKRPRLAGILVSIAGPISNLILSAIGLIIWYSLLKFGVLYSIPSAVADTLAQFFQIFIMLNIVLLVFNLLPIPPLDGYRVVEDLAPANIRAK